MATRRTSILVMTLLLGAALPTAFTQAADRTGSQTVILAHLDGVITPVTVEYVQRTLEKATNRRAALVVFEMDTPGGLASSTEDIISAILGSAVPVAVYVSPAGARAASAGLYITNASDVAAMAPGTRIGAGHPVGIMGGNPGGESEGSDGKGKERSILGEKIEHDMAAGVRSVAEIRGRNAAVYERMVRESIALTDKEALDQHVVDLIAVDLDDLLHQLDGRVIRRADDTTQTLTLPSPRVETVEMTLRQRVLSWVADPQIAIILLGIGVLGLYVEFNHPGLILPGVAGALGVILFAMSVQILPVSVLGLCLIALGVTLFVLEIKITSYGMLTVGGVLALTLGFLTLFDFDQAPSLALPLSFVLPTSLTVAAVMLIVTTVAIRAQRGRVVTGSEGLVGESGEAVTPIAAGGSGKVFVHGEYWDARSSEPIAAGARIRVTKVRQMDLDVEPFQR